MMGAPGIQESLLRIFVVYPVVGLLIFSVSVAIAVAIKRRRNAGSPKRPDLWWRG